MVLDGGESEEAVAMASEPNRHDCSLEDLMRLMGSHSTALGLAGSQEWLVGLLPLLSLLLLCCLLREQQTGGVINHT